MGRRVRPGGAGGHRARAPAGAVHPQAHDVGHAPRLRRDGRDARRWVDGSWAISHPWGSGLIYPNYPEPGRPPLDPAYHGTNLTRPRSILARYDPDGIFARL